MSSADEARVAGEVAEAERRAAVWADRSESYLVGLAATLHSGIKDRELALIELQRRLVVATREAKAAAESQAAKTATLNAVMIGLTVATVVLAVVQVWVGILK